MNLTVEILLATFNGASYLPAQLESLFNQTTQGWRLLARDDGSSDGTVEILQNARREHPDRVVLIEDREHLGAIQSFDRLLARSSAPYLMFCDQDDAWHADKIDKMLRVMAELEAQTGAETPLLVHSDLRVADENLRPMAPSFWKYQKLDPRRGESFNRLMIQNVITGCAAMINRSLCQRALPIQPGAAMHDWWLGLAAAAFGKVAFIDAALLDYRQHPGNRIGAKEWGARYVLRASIDREKAKAGLELSQGQARAFYQRFAGTLPPAVAEVVSGYAGLSQKGFFERRSFLFKHRLWKTGFSRNLGLLLWI